MKATIYSPGEITVGIPSLTLTVDCLPEPDESREEWRKALQDCFARIIDDGGVDVVFEDECPDCYSIGGHHKDCPTTWYPKN